MTDCRKCELNANCPGFADCPHMTTNQAPRSTKPETAEREELIRVLNMLGGRLDGSPLWEWADELRRAAALLAADGKAGGEVVAWRVSFDNSAWTIYEYDPTDRLNARYITVQPLYTRPQQAAQVAQPLTKLTQDQVYEIWKRTETDNRFVFADEIMDEMLAAHGIGKDQA